MKQIYWLPELWMLRAGNGIDCDLDTLRKCLSWPSIDVVPTDVKGLQSVIVFYNINKHVPLCKALLHFNTSNSHYLVNVDYLWLVQIQSPLGLQSGCWIELLLLNFWISMKKLVNTENHFPLKFCTVSYKINNISLSYLN